MFSKQRPILVAIALLVSFNLLSQITSDFSSGDEGWTATNPVTVNWSATGGNPGGVISGNDPPSASAPIYWYFIAPGKFLGNVSSLYNRTIKFDFKEAIAETASQQADAVLSNGTTSLYYFSISPSPALTTTWNSAYTITVNEVSGNWKTSNSSTGPAATKDQIKSVLLNLTLFEIRGRYGSGTLTTGSLDNVILNTLPGVNPPVITSFTPGSAVAGTSITITGSNFNSTLSQNSVYFNGTKATVSNATPTQLVVTLPQSATYGPITVMNLGTGLQGISAQGFNPLFDNNKDFGGRIIPASMAQGYKTILPMSNSSNSFGNMGSGDFDGDGWVDLVVTETGTSQLFYYRNLGTGGSVSAASFGGANALTLAGIPPATFSYIGELQVADVDNDGKLDIAAICSNSVSGFLAVYRNTSSPGTISFSAAQFFSYPYYSSQLSTTSGDFDGDGRVDFAYTTGTSPGGIWINQNFSTPGNIDFSYGFAVGTTSGHSDIAVGDLDLDGKPEIIATMGTVVEIYPNKSIAGSISFSTPFTMNATSASYVAVADLDADNKLDIAWSSYGSQFIYASQNIYSGSPLNATSFGPQINFPSKLSNPDGLGVSDINADGKPDLVIIGSSDVGVMQNIGSSGGLSIDSFLSPTLFQGSATGQSIYGVSPSIVDFDGDNKPEITFVYTNSSVTAGEKGIYILHNESFPAPRIDNMTPTSGSSGTSVSFTGDYFLTGAAAPTVVGRLGQIQTSTVASSNTSANSIASNSVSGKFSITEHGLTAISKPYSLLFDTDRVITSSSFGPSIDFTLTGTLRDALSVADFDDDGKTDVVAVDNLNTTKIFKNTQTTPGQSITLSSLTQQATTYTSGYNVLALDIDGDGKTDLHNGYGLLQNNSSVGTISFLSGPNGVYSSSGGFNTIAAADFNKDGKIDFASGDGTVNIRVYENLSTEGPFSNAVGFTTFNQNSVDLPRTNNYGGVIAEDFDGDGYEDIIATNTTAGTLTYYLNTKKLTTISSSSFSFLGNYTVSGSQPISLTANDFDGDGKVDIAVTYNNSTFISVYRNNSVAGDISFNAAIDIPSLTKGYGIVSQDLDGDGKAEIVVIHQPNPGPGSFSILKNNSSSGSISFGSAVNIPINRNPQAINIADINQDKKPDILIVANSGTIGHALMVFENKIQTPVITITSQPGGTYNKCEGTDLVLSADAIGTTNITFQWQKLNTSTALYENLIDGGAISGANAKNFFITGIQLADAGDYRCLIQGDFAVPVISEVATVVVNQLPSLPTTTGASVCGSGSVILSASGAGGSESYVWYYDIINGEPIPGEISSTYTTPVLTETTNFYVTIGNAYCETARVLVTATVDTMPSAPGTIGSASCVPTSLTLTALGGTNGQYRWYTDPTILTPISGETNSTFTTSTLSTTTTYYVSIVNGTCESPRSMVDATITAAPSAPATTGDSSCGSGSVSLSASGGIDGQYRWYTDPTILTPISGETNSIFNTPNLNTTTTYYVSIFDVCESTRTAVTATINTVISPTTTGNSSCGPASLTLSAFGGTNGQYRWYTDPTIVTPISGEVNSTFTTPTLSTTTTYYVTINNGTCESSRAPVVATITGPCNQPPAINTTSLTVQVQGSGSINLVALLSDPDNNIDLTSLAVVVQPSSGATASIDNSFNLILDYSGINFSGTDKLTIQVCDLGLACAQQEITIEVVGSIEVFNAISPNLDFKNDILFIQYIDILESTKENKVLIFNRWGDVVWETENYNNTTRVFRGLNKNGNELPSGVYYYKITFSSSQKPVEGFLSLKR